MKRTEQSPSSQPMGVESAPVGDGNAPNLLLKAFVSILNLHRKDSASRAIQHIWEEEGEEKRALDRLRHFLEEHGNDDILPAEDEPPINIMCMDGGGMRGYALLSMTGAIEKRCGGNDFLSRFDLIAGTSAGGCASIMCNLAENLADASSMGRKQLDAVRLKTLKSFSYMKLFTSGNPVKKEKQIAPLMSRKSKYGDAGSLFNEKGLNAFAVAAVENQFSDDIKRHTPLEFHSPYLLRTYKLPENDEDDESIDDQSNNDEEQDDESKKDAPITSRRSLRPFRGSLNIPKWKAIGATAAIPIVCDPVDYSDSHGHQNTLVDGGILFNCPLVIALEEAKRMYPTRKFGVILSLGLDCNQDNFAQKAADIAKVHSPDLHYQRISPGLGKYQSFEKDESKLKEMESMVYDYTMNLKGVDETINRLFESESRRKSDAIVSNSSIKTEEGSIDLSLPTGVFSGMMANRNSFVDEEHELERRFSIVQEEHKEASMMCTYCCVKKKEEKKVYSPKYPSVIYN